MTLHDALASTSEAPSDAVLDVVAHRSSPAVFDPTHDISDADLATLFDAARWAPSAGNSQPYRYLVGRRQGDEWDPTFTAIVETLARGNRRWAPAASVLAVSFVQVAKLPETSKEFVFGATAAHDTGQATAYLTLQAHAMGLAVHQFAGFDHDAIAARASFGEAWAPMAGIAVGRAWPDAERDAAHAAVMTLAGRVEEYDLASNIERENKPRRRRSLTDVAFELD